MRSDSPQSHRPSSQALAEQASLWLARRDRGLTPSEQDDYMQWIVADPRHAEAMMQHAAAFERMMHLYEWQPWHTTEGNPDLFAPRRRVRARPTARLRGARRHRSGDQWLFRSWQRSHRRCWSGGRR